VHNSLVSGGCDFIWGYPKACLFEDCEIRADAVGYIVQARVNNASDKGFVFLNCKLTAAEGVKNGAMYLARSGGSKDYYDNVTYVNCVMAPVISGTGWYASPAPNPSSASASSGWKEYGSKDLSGKAMSSHSHCKYLSDAEAAAFSSKAAVLGN
jgi:pectin methylesterase-like acyl-CoA thioesterase